MIIISLPIIIIITLKKWYFACAQTSSHTLANSLVFKSQAPTPPIKILRLSQVGLITSAKEGHVLVVLVCLSVRLSVRPSVRQQDYLQNHERDLQETFSRGVFRAKKQSIHNI